MESTKVILGRTCLLDKSTRSFKSLASTGSVIEHLGPKAMLILGKKSRTHVYVTEYLRFNQDTQKPINIKSNSGEASGVTEQHFEPSDSTLTAYSSY